jgi:hypothetical protein
VCRDLDATSGVKEVLSSDEYDTFVKSITDGIPDSTTPVQLNCILHAATDWLAAKWLSDAAHAALRRRMINALSSEYARAVAEKAALASINEPHRASACTSVTPSSGAGQGSVPRSHSSHGKSIATSQPGLEQGQRTITAMMGPKMLRRIIVASDGTKMQQSINVVEFPEPRALRPAPRLPCSFNCGAEFRSDQARIVHELFKHNGRGGVSHASMPKDLVEHFNTPGDVKRCLDDILGQVERLCASPQEAEALEAAERERAEEREAKARERREKDAAAKAAREARERERHEAGGGRRGEPQRHQYTVADKVRYIDVYDKICQDSSIANKGVVFQERHGVSATNVIKWATTERCKIYKQRASWRDRRGAGACTD